MGMARLLKLESEGGICHVSNQLLADDDPASRQLVRGQPQSRRMDTQLRTQPVQKLQITPNPKTRPRFDPRDPVGLWDQIQPHLDLEAKLRGIQHFACLQTLHRIAERAATAGSQSARSAVLLVETVVRERAPVPAKEGKSVRLPLWAQCIAPEWEEIALLGLTSSALFASFHRELSLICAPSAIQQIWQLENAVSTGFRENLNRPLNRWEGIVRTALNLALFAHTPAEKIPEVERLLRIYNPTLADCSTQGGPCPFAERLREAIDKDDYRNVFTDPAHVLLCLTAMMTVEDGPSIHVEAVAVIVASSQRRRGLFAPKLTSTFSSNDYPAVAAPGGPHETSSRLLPRHVLFGPYTPPLPTAAFVKLLRAQNGDFVRYSWRHGRRHKVRHFGQPKQ
jgi:hypothetical protein